MAYFETAIDLDPEYAPAHLGLADANLLLNNGGHMPLDEAVSKARPAIERAIDLDDWYGDLLIFGLGDPGAAIPMLQKARQLAIVREMEARGELAPLGE